VFESGAKHAGLAPRGGVWEVTCGVRVVKQRRDDKREAHWLVEQPPLGFVYAYVRTRAGQLVCEKRGLCVGEAGLVV
jgi:hypothetical protein